MIVADTGAVLALIDADDRFHQTLLDLYNADPELWLLPWAILPEVDYLLAKVAGSETRHIFLRDLAEGRWVVEWGSERDLVRAAELNARYRNLGLGLVDAVVIATAERLEADAIATLDLRHFGAVAIRGNPDLLPRDLTQG